MKRMVRKNNEYAVYKGDSFICLGTIKECADFLGVKKDSIRYYASRAYAKRGKSENPNRLIVIKIEDN